MSRHWRNSYIKWISLIPITQTDEEKKLLAEQLKNEIENKVEESFPNDLPIQNEIYTHLFNHIQERFLN
tara:strand:- start:481 stop:687 length:207 start_codon:yes stop_codon:yes gene_type:complete